MDLHHTTPYSGTHSPGELSTLAARVSRQIRLNSPNRFTRKNSTIVPQSNHVCETFQLSNSKFDDTAHRLSNVCQPKCYACLVRFISAFCSSSVWSARAWLRLLESARERSARDRSIATQLQPDLSSHCRHTTQVTLIRILSPILLSTCRSSLYVSMRRDRAESWHSSRSSKYLSLSLPHSRIRLASCPTHETGVCGQAAIGCRHHRDGQPSSHAVWVRRRGDRRVTSEGPTRMHSGAHSHSSPLFSCVPLCLCHLIVFRSTVWVVPPALSAC
jgi:hypothetical protein